MFKNDYQGGPYFEIFSVQGNQPQSKLKICGPEAAIRTKFDKDLRTFILILEGESTTSKITLPKNNKQSLHLTQQYLVFQIFIFPDKPFSLEVSITNESNLKQRIIFSSSHREVIISSLHVKMPCAVIKQNVWLNLCLDLDGLIKSVFDGGSMQVIDSTVISANCKLKRIFTLRTNPSSTLEIPESMQLRGECTDTQVIDMDSFINAGINIRSGTGNSATRRNLSTKATSTVRDKDSHTTSSGRRYTEKTIPKLKHTDSRYENLSSDEKECHEYRKDAVKHLSCCGTAIIIPKLPKPRIIKSAEYLKSKLHRDFIQNSKGVTKTADACNRRLSDISHASSFISKKLQDSQKFVRPNIRLKQMHSNSTIDLNETNKVNEKKLLFKSQSLQVLPSIKKRNDILTNENERFPSLENMNPTVNLVLPTQKDNNNNETNCLILGDDKMIDDYLQEQISNAEDESLSVSSSSCATSSGSDLFLYTSSPHSISQHIEDTENQITVNDSISESSTETIDLHSNTQIVQKSSSEKYNVLETSTENPPKLIYDTTKVILPIHESNTTLNKYEHNDLEQNNDSDYGTENYPEASSSIEYDDYNKDGSYLDDSLDEKNYSIVNPKTLRNIDLSNNDRTLIADNNNNCKSHLDTNCIKCSYAVRESAESDTMSWLNTSVDHSSCFSEKRAINKTLKSLKSSPRMVLQKRIEETLGSFINQSMDNVDDGFSDSSDDDMTTHRLPRKIKNYRYQDEIKSVSSTLDLTATIPATPPVHDQLRFSKDENNNHYGPHFKLHFSDTEELLDLLFDPVLNCYYDPKTQKYYELS